MNNRNDLGNWLEHTDRDATPITRTFDKANRMNDWGIVNTNTLHDLAGNQVKIPNAVGTALFNAAYDPLNRLRLITAGASVGVATFEYDALGRRILKSDDAVAEFSRQYYYDGVNEIMETAIDNKPMAWFVHGVGYIDERLYMYAKHDAADANEVEASFYYAIDRMYDVRFLLDAAGAIVESYSYDPYGRPLIRECAGRGDMTGDSIVSNSPDHEYFKYAFNCDAFDPRADLDNDGDVDPDDETLYYAKEAIWDGSGPTPVKTARSLIGNPYMFQGRPNFIFATAAEATDAELMLNDHRNRFADPMTGRWITRDPLEYVDGMNLFELLGSTPALSWDPEGSQQPCQEYPPPPKYVPSKCQQAANHALSVCLKAWKAAGPGAPTKDDCFETHSQSMDACARGKPGTHTKKVKAGSDYLDCMGRCIDALNADMIAALTGWAVPGAPISKKLGGRISTILGGSGRIVGVGGPGVSGATTIPSVVSEAAGLGARSSLRMVGRVAAPVFVIDSAVTAAIEAACAADCITNPNGKYK